MLTVLKRKSLFSIAALLLFSVPATADFNLRMQTDMGAFDVVMYDDPVTGVPATVSNFMDYVNTGAFDGTFFHAYLEEPRGVPGVMVTGGYTFDPGVGGFFANPSGVQDIAEINPPLTNDFKRSNTRGTLAMARIIGVPDSATNQWFINLSDNSSTLDTRDGGFTVFGEVLGNGMNVIDAIAGLGVVSSCFMYEIPIFLNCGNFFNMPTTLRGGAFDNDTLFNIHSIGTDADADGAIDNNEIDGDAAGGPDSGQSNVASAPLLDSVGEYITVVAPAANPLDDFAVLGSTYMLSRPAITECDLKDADLVYGLTSYRVTGLGLGGSASIDVILPAGSTPDAYYFYGPEESGNTNDHWYKAVQFAGVGTPGVSFNSNTVTLHLTDNGWGDADMAMDGVITVAPGGAANTIVPPAMSDGDCDGVDDTVEASLANNNGDGNSDAIQDSIQPNVASLEDVNNNFVTIEAMLPGQNIEYSSLLDTDNLFRRYFFASNPPPIDGFNFPSGFFQFSVSNVTPGGMAEVRFTLPDGAVADTYKLLGPDTGIPSWHWHDFTYNGVTGAVVNMNNSSEVTLFVQDGGRGDNDRVANGVVYLIGAPAEAITISNSTGGGGCSLQTTESAALKAGAWWLLFGLLALYRPLRKFMH